MAKYTLGTAPIPAQVPPKDFVPPPPAKKKVAVFITHGMGQQIPFQTLDQIAEGLRQRDVKAKNHNQKPVARAVKSGDQWLHRIELRLKDDANATEAHVYEAYWAPLTEGKVSIRDVIRFLSGGGANGIRNAHRGRFDRWLFETYADYPIPVRTLFYLLTALAAIAALVAMNSSIAAVAAGLAFLGQRPAWLTPGLLGDLTTTYNAVVAVLAVTGIALAISVMLRKVNVPAVVRRLWSYVTALFFTATVFVVILAGAATALLFYGHVARGAPANHRFWHAILSAPGVAAFDSGFARVATIIALVGIAIAALWWIAGVVIAVVQDLKLRDGRSATALVVAVFVLLLVALVWLVRRFGSAILDLPASTASSAAAIVGGGVAWVLLVAASGYIRRVLVQYLGDVAVYVMPYRLDAFVDLRKEIKERAVKVAQGIYGMRDAKGNLEYDEVVVVGHSLGSVIAYDALNSLIREDQESEKKLNVVARTPLLMTFGSPLDKTAFIFAQQGPGTTEAREALAATVQPLLQSYALRPRQWINIYSGWDIVSGHLSFYDLKENENHPQAVRNVKDPDATTFLIAHTEYWKNPMMLDTLYNTI